MGSLVGKWRGEAWQAMLTRELYGWHFSVSGKGRPPTDDECRRARGTDPRLGDLVEVTAAWQTLGAINPFVRHFIPERQAMSLFTKATTGR